MTKEEYKEYLKTPEWKMKREVALVRCQNRCSTCNSESPLDVHHRSYDNLGKAEEVNDLIPLCRDCHSRFHDKVARPTPPQNHVYRKYAYPNGDGWYTVPLKPDSTFGVVVILLIEYKDLYERVREYYLPVEFPEYFDYKEHFHGLGYSQEYIDETWKTNEYFNCFLENESQRECMKASILVSDDSLNNEIPFVVNRRVADEIVDLIESRSKMCWNDPWSTICA